MQLKNNPKNFSKTLILSAIIITLIALIIQTIISSISVVKFDKIENPNNLWTPIGAWANIWSALSTFTIQSNIIVLFFFIFAFINHSRKSKFKWVNGYFKLAITVYITITMIIFWVALFKPLLKRTNFKAVIDIFNFINVFLLHLFTPIITIIFYFLTSGEKKWDIKTSSSKAFPISISYMFIYLVYALVKGTFVGKIKLVDSKAYSDYSYPYFFLNIKNNLSSFFLYFFIILFLFFFLFIMYYIYNNWKYQKKYGQQLKSKKEWFKTILK